MSGSNKGNSGKAGENMQWIVKGCLKKIETWHFEQVESYGTARGIVGKSCAGIVIGNFTWK